MNIGLTYDLRIDYLKEGYGEEETAEFDRPDTVDAIEKVIQNMGHRTDRIGHVRSLVNRLAKGDRWDLVFNIAEGLRGFGREAQVPALLDAYDIAYTFSDPLVMSLTLHKGVTKHIIRDLNIPTADFAVVEYEEDIKKIDMPYPLFAKPVAEGTGKGITPSSKINSKDELISVCMDMVKKYKQPVIIETFLPGREFTVGITGTGKNAVSTGVIEVILRDEAEKDVYSYVNKEKCEELVEYRLVNDIMAKEAEKWALASWRGLGCRDGGRVDMRSDAAGIPNFMEVNPLPGIHPEHSDLPIICTKAGISYQELIERIVNSAVKRIIRS
ncbi:MAG: D-alanine--D-alanine ligase [Candidatus Eremiobacterota bacterium]